MLAVTGATGHLGRLIIAGLKAAAPTAPIVALARDPGKAADLGVEVRHADYDAPATLTTALAGVETLMLVSASEVGKRIVQHQNIIDAARVAGVRHIVYTSLLHADRSAINLAEEHRATEAALAASGIAHTVLRNGWYSENYLGSIAGAVATGTLIGSAGSGRISAAPRADYAAAAVAVLTGSGHQGKVYELAGDESFSLEDLAQMIARASGKPIAYSNLDADAHIAALVAAGVPAGFAPVIASWDAATADGALEDKSGELSRLIGRPTTPMAKTVEAAVSAV
jgi:NAD(P)H dehydrogenase (quinone)